MIIGLSSIVFLGCTRHQGIVIYTERHYETDQILFDAFTETTGIELNIVRASADELISKLQNEGDQTPADIIIFADAGRLYRAKNLDLLQPYEDEILKQQIDVGLYDDEYYWYGLTMRARAIMYAKDRVNVNELSTYEDLSYQKWDDRIAIRSSSNLYNISWIASMMMNNGVSDTEMFLNQFVDRFHRTPAGNDRDQAKLVASNVGADIAIMNTYYMGLLLNASSEYEREVGASLGVFFPNQGDNESGTHINISAAGIVNASNQVEESIQFIRFLTSNDAQSHFTNVNYEYPVNPQTTWNELLVSWGTFKRQTLDLNILGNYHEQAYELMIGAGWL